jgi:peptide/nickel transport system permease protein
VSEWRVRRQSTFDEARYNVRVFLKDKLALVGVVIVLLTIAVAVFAPQIAPYPNQGRGQSDLQARFQAPSARHLMGTDDYGRDVLSRVIFGARIPLLIAFAVIVGVVMVGVPLGGIAGYYGGKIDEVVMRITDVFLAFPALILAIAFVAFLGASIRNVMLALVICWWPWYTRLVRGAAISLRERPYVEAAKTMGVSNFTIIRRHILPNAFGPVIVQMSVDVGTVILAAASLSFLGLGAQPPTAPSRAWRSSCWCWPSTWSAMACATCSTRGRRGEWHGAAPHGPRPQTAVPEYARPCEGARRRRHCSVRTRDSRAGWRVWMRQDHHGTSSARSPATPAGRDHLR